MAFRGKRIDNGEWVRGELFAGKKIYVINRAIFGNPGSEEFSVVGNIVDKDTVCECTGLKDQNGDYIFENDIVMFCGEQKHIGIVKNRVFSDYGARGVYGWTFGKYADIRCHDHYVIIGNVFDNPEFVEGK